MHNSLSVMPMHNGDFANSALCRCILFYLVFSLMSQAVFALPPDESLEQERNRSRILI